MPNGSIETFAILKDAACGHIDQKIFSKVDYERCLCFWDEIYI